MVSGFVSMIFQLILYLRLNFRYFVIILLDTCSITEVSLGPIISVSLENYLPLVLLGVFFITAIFVSNLSFSDSSCYLFIPFFATFNIKKDHFNKYIIIFSIMIIMLLSSFTEVAQCIEGDEDNNRKPFDFIDSAHGQRKIDADLLADINEQNMSNRITQALQQANPARVLQYENVLNDITARAAALVDHVDNTVSNELNIQEPRMPNYVRIFGALVIGTAFLYVIYTNREAIGNFFYNFFTDIDRLGRAAAQTQALLHHTNPEIRRMAAEAVNELLNNP